MLLASRPSCFPSGRLGDGVNRLPNTSRASFRRVLLRPTLGTRARSAGNDGSAASVVEPLPPASAPAVQQNAPRDSTAPPAPAALTVTSSVADAEPKLTTLFELPSGSYDCDDDDEECRAFVDRSGEFVEVMCCDYGFRSGTARVAPDTSGELPFSAWELGLENFKLELEALRRSFRYDEYGQISKQNPATNFFGRLVYGAGQLVVDAVAGLDRALEGSKVLKTLQPRAEPQMEVRQPESKGDTFTVECKAIREKLLQLKLSNAAVWAREHKREAEGGAIDTPWFVKAVYLTLCVFLDVAFDNRPIQRFWFLETVARMPYFSYISVLHLYESLGWWRAGAELRKVHFAEEWNELHHLQIMESLGGDQLWIDRFMGHHAAIVYYWVLLILFIFSPRLAYNFSELIEAHAVDTYGEFADANEALLKSLPPPLVAVTYYRSPDLYMFDEFQTAERREPRRPKCSNLYDVFCNIRDDEGEHVKTMRACQDRSVIRELALRRETPRRL